MDWSKVNHRPVFISGHPKAGTSLLLNLLDSLSQLVVSPEGTMLLWIEAIAAKQMKALDYELTGCGGFTAHVHGLYWRLRQNYYFSLGGGRKMKGIK